MKPDQQTTPDGRCGSCKHWTKSEGSGDPPYLGYCYSSKFVYAYENGGQGLEEDGLLYVDAEGYHATFEVGRLFGCVHWARNEQA